MKKKIAALFLCMIMVVSLVPVTAIADEADLQQEASNLPAAAATWTPSGIDLRDQGIVTPVKQQSPWSTCWSFGAIAATETSILSMENLTYQDVPLDLSERHLIYFAQNPITAEIDAAQAGEGISVYGKEKDPNGAFTTANPILSSTLFSSGVGPMEEVAYPYQGKNGVSEYEYVLNNKEQWLTKARAELASYGIEATDARLEEIYNRQLERLKKADFFSENDDWSIPMSERNQTMGYTIVDGNVLPNFTVWEKGLYTGLNQEGIAAAKSELANGRAVAIAYFADTASPGEEAESTYINLENWAHYTFEYKSANHMVCIVGYDDNYPAENFYHTVYQRDKDGNLIEGEDGQPVIDEELTALTKPEGNGAWIVKNSWGSETDCFKNEKGQLVNYGTWGLKNEEGKHTGYFYLSYYDQSATNPETYRFAKDLDAEYFDVYQHDYMAASDGFYGLVDSSVMATANVFEIEEPETMTSVGIRASNAGDTIDIGIYRMKEGANAPNAGELLSEFEITCNYAGFHRVALPEKIPVEKGDRISIVSITQGTDKDGRKVYRLSANMAAGKALAEQEKTEKYGTAVVNPGESYLFSGGTWKDWSEYQKTDEFKGFLAEAEAVGYAVDNFTLKGYFIPNTAPATVDDPTDTKGTVITEGEASSLPKSTGKKSPKTGEGTDLAIWFVILAAGICTTTVSVIGYRRRKNGSG